MSTEDLTSHLDTASVKSENNNDDASQFLQSPTHSASDFINDTSITSDVPLPQPPENPGNTVPPKTLWMGDIETSWDEDFITELWSLLDKHVEVKVIKPRHNLLMHQLAKTNGQGKINHSGYCFIEFDTPQLATEALTLNGTFIPNTNNTKTFRLNWAPAATLDSEITVTPEYSLFVGDLSANTTEAHLLSLFQSHFNSIKTVRVMTDPSSGLSRCFGFVRFGSEDDRRRALIDMNGEWLDGRQIRVALATPKHQQGGNNNMNKFSNNNNINNNNNMNNNFMNNNNNNNNNKFNNRNYNRPMDQQMYVNAMNGQMPPGPMGFYATGPPPPPSPFNDNSGSDPNNTTVFVGGLANGLNEDTLQALFESFGTIVNIKVPQGKGCGFVKFQQREDAETAIENMQGFVIGGSRIRLSWGKSNKFNRNNYMRFGNMQQKQMFPMMGANSPPNGINMNHNNGMNMPPPPPHHHHHHNMAMFGGQNQPPMMSRAMFENGPPGSGSNQLNHSLPPMQSMDSYPHDGSGPQVVGMPPGMPPPFIYDPYHTPNGSNNISGSPEMSIASNLPIPPPSQYAIDQNGQLIYLPHQMFSNPPPPPPLQHMMHSHNEYTNNNSVNDNDGNSEEYETQEGENAENNDNYGYDNSVQIGLNENQKIDPENSIDN